MKKSELRSLIREEILKEKLDVSQGSGNIYMPIHDLPHRQYVLTKTIKKIETSGGWILKDLKKGTIIYNLPGGVFAKNKELEKHFKGHPVYKWQDKWGIAIIRSKDNLTKIDQNSKVIKKY